MIRFVNPRLLKMASGLYSLELTEAGTWASFPEFAEEYAKQVGAKVINKFEGPDIHLWEIEYGGSVLKFVYDDFPNGVSVEPKEQGGQCAVEKLYKLAKTQSDANGL